MVLVCVTIDLYRKMEIIFESGWWNLYLLSFSPQGGPAVVCVDGDNLTVVYKNKCEQWKRNPIQKKPSGWIRK